MKAPRKQLFEDLRLDRRGQASRLVHAIELPMVMVVMVMLAVVVMAMIVAVAIRILLN